MTKSSKRQDLAQAALTVIRERFGSESISLQRDDVVQIPVIETGIEVLDHYVIRCGGLPQGRIIELYGEEGSGKSSCAYSFLAAAQRVGGLAALIDSENSFDPARAAVFGVNTADLLISQPNHLEEVVSQAEVAIDVLSSISRAPSVIAWDSVAATQTKDEFEGGIEGKDQMGNRAKFLSRAMRILGSRVAKHPICFVCINQVRENIGVMFGDKYTTPGGHAIKFHSSVRLQLFHGKAIKNTLGEHIGNTVTFLATKNRFAPPYRKAQVRLDYDSGWNNLWSTISHAKDQKLIPAGAKYVQKTYNEAISQLGWFPDGAVKAEATPELPNP